MKLLSALLLCLALAASLALLLALPKDWLLLGSQVKAQLAATGLAAPLVFFLASAVLTGLGAPRLLFCFLAGWSFGFGWGFVLSQFGTLLGAYGVFLLARRIAPERLLQKYPKLKTITVPVGRGWWSVLLVRQLPISGLYNDILLGWSPVTHRDFWVGSFLGFLPLGVTASLMGAGAIQADLVELGKYCALAAVLFFLLNYSVKWVTARKTA
ncbi:Uncharacterized membrane protein YdjX, TVP38/TMEM64 family, SNARE-associated domain [Methylomagnum ishizawai]|uniref:TVP38/TMEM64 family membrane protein n=1 Tax=Methylomagnum ishizawai TaxID=1760988 RepID=A0A1Y6CUK6_9GAMM|nr:VTT domain-containing protein [Methylomagnum ishizawai]SMF93880.1 Uncharacterized membrane protein YdjX, TVP38/TMEM64 family, SNARE-associated domain [Methylomagnum ishizawai]